jgi:hypothetical protein
MPECNEDGLGYSIEDEVAENDFSTENPQDELPITDEPEEIPAEEVKTYQRMLGILRSWCVIRVLSLTCLRKVR